LALCAKAGSLPSSAEFLNSSLTRQEAQLVENRVVSGKADLLYVAPERLQSESFQRFIQKFPIAVFAIDEAHCVSQWGEYLTISEVTDNFPNVPRIALTATADAVTRQDILDKLKLGLAAQFVSSFDRANIYYRVLLKNKDKQQLYDFIQSEHSGDPGIVYVRTRRRADQIASWLQEKGLPAFSYHAGLDPQISDHCIWHGHRQARRTLCRPFGFAGQHGGLLPGDRTGRPGWATSGCMDGLFPC
jgi:ATP-dependent DNA helicase RecQ